MYLLLVLILHTHLNLGDFNFPFILFSELTTIIHLKLSNFDAVQAQMDIGAPTKGRALIFSTSRLARLNPEPITSVRYLNATCRNRTHRV